MTTSTSPFLRLVRIFAVGVSLMAASILGAGHVAADVLNPAYSTGGSGGGGGAAQVDESSVTARGPLSQF